MAFAGAGHRRKDATPVARTHSVPMHKGAALDFASAPSPHPLARCNDGSGRDRGGLQVQAIGRFRPGGVDPLDPRVPTCGAFHALQLAKPARMPRGRVEQHCREPES